MSIPNHMSLDTFETDEAGNIQFLFVRLCCRWPKSSLLRSWTLSYIIIIDVNISEKNLKRKVIFLLQTAELH